MSELPIPADEPEPAPGTFGALIWRARALVAAVATLVASESMASVATLIQQLGIGGAVKRCVDTLNEVVKFFEGWVETLRAALVDKESLVGLLGLLRPLVRGLRGLVRASGDKLAELGLRDGMPALEPVGALFEVGERWAEKGAGVLRRLPEPKDVDVLGEAMAGLVKALGELAGLLAAPPPSPAPEALP